MEVHRIELADYSHRMVKEVSTRGHVHSNFLEDELAGCILSSGGPTYEIVIVNCRTGKFAKINTGIEVKVKNFSRPNCVSNMAPNRFASILRLRPQRSVYY
jgi:hypothetical protein